MDFENERERLVRQLEKSGVAVSESIKNAFRIVPREEFVLPARRSRAYEDTALPLGVGTTISQPTTIAIMLEALKVGPGSKVLEIGSGSGYVLALLAEIVGASGSVTGIEIIPQLCEQSKKTLKRFGFFGKTKLDVVSGDGQVDVGKSAAYDGILVSAAARTVPKNLLKQLSKTGHLVVPVGGSTSWFQEMMVFEKDGSCMSLGRFAFVPLVGGGGGGGAGLNVGVPQ